MLLQPGRRMSLRYKGATPCVISLHAVLSCDALSLVMHGFGVMGVTMLLVSHTLLRALGST